MASGSYLFPTDHSNARSVALTPYASGLLVSKWDSPLVWYWSGSSYTSAAIATTTAYGFSSSDIDGASGAWLAQYLGQLVHYPVSGSVSYFQLPIDITTGCSYVSTFNKPYVIGSSGQIYTTSGTGITTVGAPFSGSPTWGLESSGTTLFTIMAATKQLGTFALSSSGAGVSGAVALPMDVPLCLAASTAVSAVTVGGYTNAAIPQSFSFLATDPASPAFVGANVNTNSISIYKSSTRDVWAISQTFAGLGNPKYAGWATDGLHFGISDAPTGQVSIYNYIFGNATFVQNVIVPNAGPITFVSPNTAVICQPVLNSIATVYTSATLWVTGNSVSLSGVTTIAQNNLNQAIAGATSGLAFLNVSPNTQTLSIITQVPLPFTPVSVASDLLGNNCAVGTSGASGFLAVLSGQTVDILLSWAGSGTAVTVFRDQFVVVDSSIPCLRIFGYLNDAYRQISIIASVPPGLDGADISVIPISQFNNLGGSALVIGASATWEYQFVSPWGLVNIPNGIVSTYTNGFWINTILGIDRAPTAITYNSSNLVQATTTQNFLYKLDNLGNVLSIDVINPYAGQIAGIPLGFSSLASLGTHLYGASSLNGGLTAFDQTLGPPWI